MKVVAMSVGRSVKFVLGAVAVFGAMAGQSLRAQSPYVLPYTIQSLAGGGTSVVIPTTTPPTLSTPCTGPGAVGSQYDNVGDGCAVTSTSVVVGSGADVHDVGVDAAGNVYFIDSGGSNAVIRRIDARSGIITVYAGSYTTPQPPCAATIDKYGDGCPANDGRANNGTVVGGVLVNDGYTGGFAKARGIAVAKNGDVYLAQYSGNVVNKISASTGLMTLVAGLLGGGTPAKPTGNIGQKGYTGDGGPATSAELNGNRGVTVDAAGNLYIADSGNNVIRKVTAATGIISTIVGTYPGSNTNAPAGATGDGGPAALATLTTPEDVEVDANGNLFIGDFGNNKVRVVYQGGTVVAKIISLTNPGTTAVAGNIYTIIGGGTGTLAAGTPALATSVAIGNPRKIAIDARGNIYVADNGFNVVEFFDATTGFIRVLAGTPGVITGGTYCAAKSDAFGDNCPGTQATLSGASAMGVAVDAQGNVYVTDTGDGRLRKVVTNQNFPATAAGSTSTQQLQIHFAAGDTPAGASPYVITGNADFVVANSNCTLNGDTTTDCLVTVNFKPSVPGTDSAVLTVASTLNGTSAIGIGGTGTAASVAFDPGAASAFGSTLSGASGIAQDGSGNTYIADTGNNRVVRLTSGGTQTVVAGTGTSGYTGDGAAATAAKLAGPKAVAVSRDGLVYIADTGNNVIRQINPATGVISTIGGGATTVCSTSFDSFGDGCLATASKFLKPAGLAVDSDGNVYVADSGNGLIREVTPNGYVFLVGGGAAVVCTGGDTIGNGCNPTSASFSNPTGIQLDASRNLYVADTGNNEVRELVAATGTVIIRAGTGQAGSANNGGPATAAQLSGPTGLAVDAAGDLYIADSGNGAVRLVNAAGIINTAVGVLGVSGAGSLPSSAFTLQLNNPSGVVSNGAGKLIVLDSGNNRAVLDDRGSVTNDFGRTKLGSSSPTLQINETSTGSVAATLSNAGSPLFTPVPAPPFSLAGTGSNGCTAGQTLTPGASCLLAAQFSPSLTQSGVFTGTFTETTTNTINVPAPFIKLLGTGAVLTTTTSTTVVTVPATGSPQYSVPFTVTTTVVPATCNVTAPSCFPTGTVSFFVDGTGVGIPVAVSAAGVASQVISGQTVGVHVVTAVYNGDPFYSSSTATPLSVSVTLGTTTTVVTANPANGKQFDDLTLTATVTSKTTSIPTGTVTFFAGTTKLGTASVTASTGIAILQDVHTAATKTTPEHLANSFGLPAGTYALTAVYSGETNYSGSTSAATPLVIGADAPGVTVVLGSSAVGTAQGSTTATLATVTPSNTLSGTLTFSCTGLPANSVCTFSPTSLTFVPTAVRATPQQTSITLWTDVPPGVIPTGTGRSIVPHSLFRGGAATSLATLLGWPMLLTSLLGIFAFRKRLRQTRLLAALALFGVLAGSTTLLSGCSGNAPVLAVTPVGTYTVNFVVTGSNGISVSTPVQFTVGQGAPGQL